MQPVMLEGLNLVRTKGSVFEFIDFFNFFFQVPVNLLRAGRIFVFEPPPGVKANMLRTFSSIPVSRMCKVRLHFMQVEECVH